METERRLCPNCLEVWLITSTGHCNGCNLYAYCRGRFPLPTREYVLAHSNDGSEYETPVMEAEYPR